MSKNHPYIAQLCRSLQQQGTTPSVAVIKKHADRPLALPDIIAVLQKWKTDPAALPTSTDIDSPAVKKPSQTEIRISALEQRVSELERQLAAALARNNKAPKPDAGITD